jgi:hypothetical protein
MADGMSGRIHRPNGNAELFGNLVALLGLGCILVAVAIWVWQAVHWLQSGVYPGVPLSQAWAYLVDRPLPHVEWIGAQQIVAGVFDIPTAAVLFFIGIAAVIGGLKISAAAYVRR